jgi:hypothetical protein
MHESFDRQFALKSNEDTYRTTTLSPLPGTLRDGLIAVTILGFLSFLASLSLFLLLSWRIATWIRRGKPTSQFVFLIYNLILADCQQSLSFLLNARWLVEDGIMVNTSTCWSQGFFVSTGDMASGAFCFLIGLHTFASVIFDYRLSNFRFGVFIVAIWFFVYAAAVVGVALHPTDLYVRAVAWCWMNKKYSVLRLWLHYFWIFTFEFGTVLVYLALWAALQYRLKTNYYDASTSQAKHARNAAKLMIVYPITYVICTLPLATLRMISMTTPGTISFGWFCFAGALITSNGWLDVVLYTMTRRIMLFSDDPPPDSYGIETFHMPFGGEPAPRFGTRTTCEANGSRSHATRTWMGRILHGDQAAKDLESQATSHSFGSTEQLYFEDMSAPTSPLSAKTKGSRSSHVSRIEKSSFNVKTETTVQVTSEPLVELEDMAEMRAMKDALDRVRPKSGGVEEDDVEFMSKPEGWK